MTAPSEFLNQDDPERIAVETRDVKMGAVRRENEQPGASGVALSLPEMFNAPPPGASEPVISNAPIRELVFTAPPPEPSSPVPPEPEDGINREAEAPVVQPAEEPLQLPDFTQPLPFTPISAQPQQRADDLFKQQQLGRGAENLVRFAGSISSFQIPTPFRSYAAPPSEPDVSGAVRQAQFYNDYQRRLNDSVAATNLVPSGTLSPQAEEVLRRLPLLDPTRPILNQIPGGLTGQVGEPEYDQRWLSGSWFRALGRAVVSAGNQLLHGDYLLYLNPFSTIPAIGSYIMERQRRARPVDDAMRSLVTGGRVPFKPSESLGQRIATLPAEIGDRTFQRMSPEAQRRTRETARSFQELFDESLAGFLPEELEPGKFRFDPIRGYFGEMGAGIPGAVLYGLSLFGNSVTTGIYTATDAQIELADLVSGGRATQQLNRILQTATIPQWLLEPGVRSEDVQRPQIVNTPGYNPFFRVQQTLSGVDLGFTNPMGLNGNRYLAPGLGKGFRTEARVLSYLLGFGADLVTGGFADSFTSALVGLARRRAIAVSRRGLSGLNPLTDSAGSRTARAVRRLFEQQRAARMRRRTVGFERNRRTPPPPPPTPTAPPPPPGVSNPAAPASPASGGRVNYTTVANNLTNSPVNPRNQLLTNRARSERQLAVELNPSLGRPQRQLPAAPDPVSRAIVPVPRDVSPEELRLTDEAFESALAGSVRVDTPNGITVVLPTDTTPRTSSAPIVPTSETLLQRIDRYVDDLIDMGDAQIVDDNALLLPDGTTRRRITAANPRRALPPSSADDAGAMVRNTTDDITSTTPPPPEPTTSSLVPQRTTSDMTVSDAPVFIGEAVLEQADEFTVQTAAAARRDVLQGSPTARLLVAQPEVRPAIVETATRRRVVAEQPGGILVDVLERHRRIATYVATQRAAVEDVLRRGRKIRPELIEDVRNGLRSASRASDASRVSRAAVAPDVPVADETIQELEEFIANQENAIRELLRQSDNTIDRAKRLELAQRRQAIRERIDLTYDRIRELRIGGMDKFMEELDAELDGVPLPTDIDRATVAAASPVIPARAFAPSMTPGEYLRFMDSEEYFSRLGVLRSDDIAPVKRTGRQLTQLGQYLVDDTGKPIVNPARRTELNKRELDRLRARYPGIFDKFGRPIPDEILHPQARVEIVEPRLNEPSATQFLESRPVPLSPLEAESTTDLPLDVAQAELFESQLSLDDLRKLNQRRDELLNQMWSSDDVPENLIDELVEIETAITSFPTDPAHPAVVRSVNDRLLPNTIAAGDMNDLPVVQEYLTALDEMDEAGTGLRQLAQGIDEIVNELDDANNAIMNAPHMKRGQTSDELANGVNMRAGGNDDAVLPRHVDNLVRESAFRETTPVDLDARAVRQAALDEDIPNLPVDEMAQRAVQNVDVWYHGTKQGDEAFFSAEFDPRQGSSAEFGSGLYLTDRADVAEMYARASLDPSYRYPGTTRFDVPKVFQFPGSLKPRSPLFLGRRVTDLSETVRTELDNVFRNAITSVFGTDETFLETLRNLNRKHPFLRDRWLNVREAFAETFTSPISESMYQEFSAAVADGLRRLGYDSLVDTHSVRGRTLVILPADNFWQESFLPPNTPSVPLRSIGDADQQALEAAMARHQADALLNRAMERTSTSVWEHQSRIQMLEELLQRYTKEYDNLVEEGLGASDNALRLQRQLREMRADYDIRRMRDLENAGTAQQTRRAQSIDTDKPNPCI